MFINLCSLTPPRRCTLQSTLRGMRTESLFFVTYNQYITGYKNTKSTRVKHSFLYFNMFVPPQQQTTTSAVKRFVERIANTLSPRLGSSFEASFDLDKRVFGRSLIRVAHAQYLRNKRASCLSAGLQYLSTYLSHLHTAYALWSSSVEYRLTRCQREIVRERLTGIAKLQRLVCIAAI